MQPTVSSYSSYRRVTIPVADLNPQSDRLQRLKKRLESQPGVRLAYIDPRTEMVFVVYNPSLTELAPLCELIRQEGYEPGKPSQR